MMKATWVQVNEGRENIGSMPTAGIKSARGRLAGAPPDGIPYLIQSYSEQEDRRCSKRYHIPSPVVHGRSRATGAGCRTDRVRFQNLKVAVRQG